MTTGERASRRFALANPLGKEPEDFATAIAQIVRDVSPVEGTPVGVGFPESSAAGWCARPRTSRSAGSARMRRRCSRAISVDVVVINDADAAGVAEREFGAIRDHDGLCVFTTLGTGIGTALVYNGVVIPNSELGHVHIDGPD